MQAEQNLEGLTALIRNAGQISQPEERTCPNCNGDGWVVRVVEGHSRKAFRCMCQISSRIAYVIPRSYRTARLVDFKTATITRIWQFFGNPNSLGLLITGPTGVGKTYLAAAVARQLIEAQQEVRFREMSWIYSELRDVMRRNESEGNFLADYAEVRWLVLDDFGSGALTDFERRYALDLLNRRANARLKTIVTTNCELEVIAEKLDERIASRLSGFDQIGASGNDRRAQQRTRES